MWRSRNSGENRSSRRICLSESAIWRAAVVFSSLSRRSCFVSSLWRDHNLRTRPADTWMPLSDSSWVTLSAARVE